MYYRVEEYEEMSPVGEITCCRVVDSTGTVVRSGLHIDQAEAIAVRLNSLEDEDEDEA